MTHDEMIAVIAAHRDGKKIERRPLHVNDCLRTWVPCVANNPAWTFASWEYRVAEPRWRLATIDDLRHAPLVCRVRHCDDDQWLPDVLAGISVASGRVMWQTSDFFWHTQCQVIDEQE